jgi:peptidyl-prolyl cis-trans isomerase SurA
MKAQSTLRTALLLASLALPAAAQLAPVSPAAPGSPVEVNGIAAKVNGRVITKNQVSFMLAPIYAQLATQFPRRGPPFETEFKKAKKVLQELVDRAIILDEFKQLGASIKPHIIDEEVKRQILTLYNGDERQIPRGTPTQPAHHARIPRNDPRKNGRPGHARPAVLRRPTTPAQRIQKEYQDVKHTLRDVSKDVISFRRSSSPPPTPKPGRQPGNPARPRRRPRRQLDAGADFAEIAKTHSRDAFADQGRTPGKRPPHRPRPRVRRHHRRVTRRKKSSAPCSTHAVSPSSKSSRSDYGPAPPCSDRKVREMIEERVRKKKTSAQYERWIESRRKRAMIDIRL